MVGFPRREVADKFPAVRWQGINDDGLAGGRQSSRLATRLGSQRVPEVLVYTSRSRDDATGGASQKLSRFACWLCRTSYPHGNPNFAKSIEAVLGSGWEVSSSCSSISFVPESRCSPRVRTFESSRSSGLSFFDFVSTLTLFYLQFLSRPRFFGDEISARGFARSSCGEASSLLLVFRTHVTPSFRLGWVAWPGWGIFVGCMTRG